MKVNHILEILISLGIIYFLFSTLVSIIFEWYTLKTKKRGQFLHMSIHKLLNDPSNQSYGATFYSHHSIDRLKKDKHSYPQYISSSMFADALIDIIGQGSEEVKFDMTFKPGSYEIDAVDLIEVRNNDPYQRFVSGVDKMHYSPLKNLFRSFYEKSGDYVALKLLITDWYNDYMERVSGWYKARTKRALFYIGLLVALVFNLDTIRLIKTLNRDNDLRKTLVMEAEKEVNRAEKEAYIWQDVIANDTDNVFTDSVKNKQILAMKDIDRKYYNRLDSQLQKIEDLSLPVGYQGSFPVIHGKYWIFKWLAGILFSAYALSFGAPFWFDIMIKLINARKAGIKPRENNTK